MEFRSHGRLTPVVAFELPITNEAINGLLASESDPGSWSDPLSLDAVEADIREVIASEASTEPYALYAADSGRGASGYAVALELLGLIANIGGTAAVAAGSIEVTRRLYSRIRERLGYRPNVSLGTACFLAAADLSKRLGHCDFSIHGAGDARSDSPDSSYTGNDHFIVIFAHDDSLFLYLANASGQVRYVGEAPLTFADGRLSP